MGKQRDRPIEILSVNLLNNMPSCYRKIITISEVKDMKFKYKVYEEAQRRMNYLIEMYGINPNLGKYLKEGRVYYSYFTAGGMLGSIDTISYVPRYEEILEEFENKFGGYVYHCIEESESNLILLYVGKSEDEWNWEFEETETQNGICITSGAYVYNLDKNWGEIGSVLIATARDVTGNVNLIRIG